MYFVYCFSSFIIQFFANFPYYIKKKKYPDDCHFMKQNSHFWEGKKTPKNNAKSTNLSSNAYNDVNSFSISFGCKILSDSEVTSFQSWKYEKRFILYSKNENPKLEGYYLKNPWNFWNQNSLIKFPYDFKQLMKKWCCLDSI